MVFNIIGGIWYTCTGFIMELVELARSGLCLSPVGMGTAPMVTRVHGPERVDLVRRVVDLGVNWFDTARRDADAETVLGAALKGIRDRIIIVTKSGAHDPAMLTEHINESLRQLKTDYVDVFLFHGGGAVKNEAFGQVGGLLETVEDARRAGKIRFLGFSAHSEELACTAIEVESFDFAMVPANFISTRYIDGPFMDAARERDVTVFAMKPFGGGRIEAPRLCLNFLKQYPGLMPCVGVDRVDQMEENLRIWEDSAELNANDLREIDRIRNELDENFCRQCGYCLPCPQGVPIISMNLMEAWVKQLSPEALAGVHSGGVEKARECVECRECVEKCPYDLPIPELLKDGIELFERTTAEA